MYVRYTYIINTWGPSGVGKVQQKVDSWLITSDRTREIAIWEKQIRFIIAIKYLCNFWANQYLSSLLATDAFDGINPEKSKSYVYFL